MRRKSDCKSGKTNFGNEYRFNQNNTYVLNEFLTGDTVCTFAQENIFEKFLTKACIPLFYASFGTICPKIGQLFEAHRVFEVCLKID